ncbi:MAG: alpha-N-acetylglucosaminidase TIM-barrel domain-containing protein [Pirellulales bacterium]
MRSPITTALALLVSCMSSSSLSAQQQVRPLDSGKADATAKAHEEGTITVVVPPAGEKAYQIAGDLFVEMWERVTQRRPGLIQSSAVEDELPPGDVVLIGSDAVQPIVHGLIGRGVLDTLELQYGTDSYRILCVPHEGRRLLIVAGGSGRSTLYAVYDFFRRRAGVEYFWDGDVVPRQHEIDFSGMDVIEKPHFRYRGLRYFAHRGLHRFQAEHWDLEDWKREIDWLVKKRFNLFMLRTGIDDLFQRAFPGEVPYPPTDAQDPDAEDRSYNDRTSFWPLKYRGELRKRVLQYAFDRGLLHPEDTGTITHWYSHTPSSFYRSHPGFPVITDQTRGYTLATAAIWDIEHESAWDAYWKLTETHIREYGQPRMFHTIGMAERLFGKTKRDNFQRKLYVYRKTQQKIREHYPDAPLLLASWDFAFKWEDEEVRQLWKEFDPERTILLDYTADDAGKVSYRDWNVLGRFPWIFGIFHGFARNSDIHEDYAILAERLEEAKKDPMCRGLVLWSEISHNDTFMLEYLAENSWQPRGLEVSAAVKRFCRTRYPGDLAPRMEPLWSKLQVTSQTAHWSLRGTERVVLSEPQFHMLTSPWLTFTPLRLAELQAEREKLRSGLEPAPEVLAGLATLAEMHHGNSFWRRDALDMARTIANRALLVTLIDAVEQMEAWRRNQAGPETIRKLAPLNRQLLDALCDLLALSDDFSMTATLRRLEQAKPFGELTATVNPHSEQTLKGNAENNYCRSHHYELARYVYRKEADVFWDYVLERLESGQRQTWGRPTDSAKWNQAIEDEFFATPLARMKPQGPRETEQFVEAVEQIEVLVRRYLATARPEP